MAAVQYVLAHLDFGGNGEIRNVVLGSAASRPSSPVAGAIFFNSTNDRVEYFDGSEWQVLSSEVFTAAAHDLHDHSAVASTIALNEVGQPTGDINFAGVRLTNVGAPTDSSDAATKGYVDNEISAVNTSIGGLGEGLDFLSTALNSEISDRQSADESLSGRLDTVETTLANLDATYATEAEVATAVAAEASAREAADSALDGRLDTVESTLANLDATYATEAEVSAAVAGEAARATAAEEAIASDLADEVSRATAAEAALASDISDEATARAAADTALAADITALDGRLDTVEGTLAALDATYATDAQVTAAVAAETAAREAAVSAEATARDAADDALDARITAIESAPYSAKKVFTIGDGSATTFTVTHNLGSDVVVQVKNASTGAVVLAAVTQAEDTATIDFTSAPANNGIKVVVIG